MKTIVMSIALLVSTLALAAPAAAECVNNDTTGTSACVDVNPADTRNRDAYVHQAGLAMVDYNAYEYSFFGSTYRGEGLSVNGAYDGPLAGTTVMYDSFCRASPDGSCMGESRSVYAGSNDAGSVGASLNEWGGERELCYSTYLNEEFTFECTPLL